MIRAAGILCIATNGHVLLLKRTDGQGWAFPGGGLEDEESAEDAARREFGEETGAKVKGDLKLWTRSILGECDFSTFLYRCEEFTPVLNEEHSAFQWTALEFALGSSLLHPGVGISLRRFGMDELAIAKAIRDGELTSPQRYGNLLLIAIRITGTGVSYRLAHDEFVWRDPAIYRTAEFLERCNGLPVILDHPEDVPMLNTEEFHDRMVGTVFLPYFKGNDEVWSIAKVFDMRVADVLENEQMSTSPAVVFMGVEPGSVHKMKDDNTLLIEGKPSLLDHVALCSLGVWDKGGPPTGVDSIDTRTDALNQILYRLKLDELCRRTNAQH